MSRKKTHTPKVFIFIGLITALFLGCEVDDVCTEEVLTPRLIVGFYNTTNHNSIKEIDLLNVWAIEKDSLYKNVKKDSILLPLDLSNTQTKYILSVDGVIDTLHIYHENNEIFLSRSCGYKYNFTLQDTSSLTHNWSTDFETVNTPQIIENEQNIHLKIYH